MSNLQIGKSRHKTAGTRSQPVRRPAAPPARVPCSVVRSARVSTEQDIIRHVHSSALQKFCTLCGSLNADPLAPHTPALVLVLLSRHTTRVDIARRLLAARGVDASLLAWDTAADIDFLQQKLSSSSDWAILLGYLEFELDDGARAQLEADPVLAALRASLLATGVIAAHTPLEFVMHCLVYMTPAGTPSPKMLERFLAQHRVDCRDVEVKCLRAVTSFTDEVSNDGQLATCLLRVCLATSAAATLVGDLQDVLDAQQADTSEPVDVAVHRLRLRDIVERVHQANALSYELTFDSWCCQKKFASTTGLNVQRLLYFINAQTCAVDFERFPDYFTPAMTGHLALQELTTIDIAPIHAVIASLRLYTNNIKHLIDFRVLCLEGLNVRARQGLSQAQILQLYICCFQHESVRDRCWRAVLPVLNHTMQRACAAFRARYAFEIEAVLRSVIF